MAVTTSSLFTAVQLEADNSNGAPAPRTPNPLPRLSFAKPSLVVRTEDSDIPKSFKRTYCKNSTKPPSIQFQDVSILVEKSNVRREVKKKPDPFCVVCKGSGRADCHHCLGRGRTNFVHLAMLPKGEWPKWCRTCGGSGLSYCSRCLGTGEYRYIMGFHFMKMDTNHTRDQKKCQVQGDQEHRNAADLILDEEQWNLNHKMSET